MPRPAAQRRGGSQRPARPPTWRAWALSSTARGKCRYPGRGQAEGFLQQDLPRRRVEQVAAAHDVGNSLRGVVHDDGQLVGMQAVTRRSTKSPTACGDVEADVAQAAIDEIDDAVRARGSGSRAERGAAARTQTGGWKRSSAAVAGPVRRSAASSLRLQLHSKLQAGLPAARAQPRRPRAACSGAGRRHPSGTREARGRQDPVGRARSSRGGSRSSMRTQPAPPCAAHRGSCRRRRPANRNAAGR